MHRFHLPLLLLAGLLVGSKNGLALVERSGEIPAAGEFRIKTIGFPVHGTLWLDTKAPVIVRTRMEETDEPLRAGERMDPQRDLAGAEVRIHFKGPDPAAPVDGTIEQLPAAAAAAQPGALAYTYNTYGHRVPVTTQASYLILRHNDGAQSFIDPSIIAMIQSKAAKGTLRRQRPTLTIKAGAEAKGALRITYMCRGISWAPSYLVDLSDEKKLRLTQKAVVRNELADLEAAQLQLISGFPNFSMGHVTSPLSPQTSWSAFFSQLRQNPQSHNDAGSQVASQMIVVQNYASPSSGSDLGAPPAGEGVDLHVQDIGAQDLRKNETLALQTGSAEAEYERIVEWVIPDTRNADGRQYGNSGSKNQDSVWDAVRFRNPLDMPMTTGPALFMRDGGVAGQQTSFWVSAGELTNLRITKALSLRTRHTELEVQDDNRATVYVGGRRYRKVKVKGTCEVNNHRAEELRVLVTREFSGELAEASDKPSTRLLETGVYSANRRNALTWEFTLAAGKEKTLSYEYDVLVSY